MNPYENKEFIKKCCEDKKIHPSWLELDNPTIGVKTFWIKKWKETQNKKREDKLWNPIDNTRISYIDMVDKFGEDLATACYESNNKYSKKLISALHKTVQPKEVEIKFQKKPNPKHTIREPFIGVSKMMLKDTTILKMNANKTMLYFMLRANVWDWSSVADNLDIFGRFYVDKQLLAASFTHNTLADYFGVDKRSIIRWLNQLEDEGALIRYKQYDEETKQYKPTVYVMGFMDEEGYDIYLLDNHNVPEAKEIIVEKLSL